MTPGPPVLVLAAGSAERYGSDKLQATFNDEPLLSLTLRLVVAASPRSPILVVIGAGQNARRDICLEHGVQVVKVAQPERGMRWSLAAGLAALPPNVDGAIILLADTPLASRGLPAVRAAAQSDPQRPAAMRRTPFVPHPVYLPRNRWPLPPTADEDTGLRGLLEPGCIWIDDAAPAPIDVDVPTDRAALQRALDADA